MTTTDLSTEQHREATARRLLQSSVDRNYDPSVDLDWSAPIDPAVSFHPPELTTLYGTDLWDELTAEQQHKLGRLEQGWTASQGIIAEIGLMTMLLRVGTMDPRTLHGQYALTELADECRHSTMFSRGLETMRQPGDPQIPTLPPVVALVARVLGALISDSPTGWSALLYVEDTLDKLQRETMRDERLQPLVRMINRIHVTEEARHMSYAREELDRSMVGRSRRSLALHRALTGLMVLASSRLVVPGFVYAEVGLDPERAVPTAWNNPHRQANAKRHAERYIKTMEEAGLIVGRISQSLWSRSGLRPVEGVSQ
ncbi:MAG TPA: diiron oxygenase [Nocardioidaceae bacterium]|nr:diiron oxygenase [Nocardioidaceae bacterium]